MGVMNICISIYFILEMHFFMTVQLFFDSYTKPFKFSGRYTDKFSKFLKNRWNLSPVKMKIIKLN